MKKLYPDCYDYDGEENYDEYDFEDPEDDEIRKRHIRKLRRRREELIVYSSIMTGLLAGFITHLIIKRQSR